MNLFFFFVNDANMGTICEQTHLLQADVLTPWRWLNRFLAAVWEGMGPVSINRCCPVTVLKGRGRGARCWADPRTEGPADKPMTWMRFGSRQWSSGTHSRRWRISTFPLLFPLQTWQ